MKKVILSIALIAGIAATSTIQATNSVIEQPSVMITWEDDGFVDVKFEDLAEKVQDAVRIVAQDYDLNALQFNTEKQLTKVVATKKDDQTKKTFYLDIEGKEVVIEEAKTAEETVTQEQEEAPSPESFYTNTPADDGFVEIKLEELNEKVQAAINGLKETYEIDALKYNADKQITQVEATHKEDESKKTIYLDNEGAETTCEKPVEEVL